MSTVLIYLPGLASSEDNSAKRIAELVAQFGSTVRDGTYTVQSQPNSKSVKILDPTGNETLEVIEVNYWDQLYGIEPDGPALDKRSMWTALGYSLFGLRRLFGALARRNTSKTPRAKWQLFIGFLMVVALFVSFAFIALTVLAAIFPRLWPALLSSDPTTKYVVGASGTTLAVAVYWWLRPRSLAAGRILRATMRYIQHDSQMIAVADAFDRTYDEVVQSDKDAVVHVLAYSFGCIVALDALIPRRWDVERRSLDNLKSLATVGAPIDFIRQFYPNHFGDRVNSRFPTGIPWMNIYASIDVFGSDFKSANSRRGRDSQPPGRLSSLLLRMCGETDKDGKQGIADLKPSANIQEDHSIAKIGGFWAFDGFSIHAKYWAAKEPRYLRCAIPRWLTVDDKTVPQWSVTSRGTLPPHKGSMPVDKHEAFGPSPSDSNSGMDRIPAVRDDNAEPGAIPSPRPSSRTATPPSAHEVTLGINGAEELDNARDSKLAGTTYSSAEAEDTKPNNALMQRN